MPGEDLDATVSLTARVGEAGGAGYGATDHLAEMQAAQQTAPPWAGGKVTLSAPGTPYSGDRYVSDTPYYPPPPAVAPLSRDEAMRMVMEEAGQSYAPPPQALSAIEARMPYSDNVASRLSDPSAPWNAPPPARDPILDSAVVNPPASRYSSFEEANQAKADILADAKNLYASSGRFTSIGSEAFNGEVQEALIAQGLAEPETPKKGGGHQGQMGYALGGGILELAGGASRVYEEENRGKYLTPEQQGADAAGMLPGAGAVVGALAGMAIPGVGPMLGAMVGGGAGSLAEGVISAGSEREQATREAAERLAAALGTAAESVSSFKTQIEATGAPVQQLAQSLGVVGGVGTYGPGTVAGVGALTTAFQERAGEDFSAIARYSSGPLLHDMGARVGGGLAGAGDIVSMGFDAAEQGDFSGLKTLQQAARDAAAKADPAYQNAARKFNSSSSLAQSDNWATKADLWVHDSLPWWLGGGTDDDVSRARDARVKMESRHKELGKPVESEIDTQNALINQFAEMKGGEIVAEGRIGVASAGLSLAGLRGASASALAEDSKPLYAGVEAARTQTASEIRLLQSDLADPARSAGRVPELQSRIAVAETRMAGYDVTEAQQRRSVMGAEFDESASRYGLARAGEQDDLLSGLYGGGSFAQLRGDEDRILSTEGARASQIRREALNPLLNPAERAKKLAEATGIDSQERVERYQFAQNVYQEENATLDITRAQRAGAVERADFLGTPGDVYGATIAGLQSDRDQIAQNNSEIGRGNLTNDQVLRLRKQNTDLQNEITVAPERARIAAYDAEEGILGDTRAADRSQLSRNVSINGSPAYGPGVFADDRAEITHLRGAEDGSPLGSVQRARFGRERAGAEAALLDDTTQSQLYRETSAERTEDNRVQGAYRRSQISPWMDGSPDGDPLTRRNAELGNLQSRLTGAQRALDGSTDPLAREQNSARVEDYKDQIAEIEHDKMFAIERLLPEMIAGAGGRGTLAGVLPTKGQAAYFNPNPYVTGSWGPAPRPAGAAEGGDHPQVPGGASGRFLAAHGGAPGDDPALALLARIANSLENLKTLGGRSPATLGGVSGGFNAQRPRNSD